MSVRAGNGDGEKKGKRQAAVAASTTAADSGSSEPGLLRRALGDILSTL